MSSNQTSPSVSLHRTGTRQYQASNGRGGTIEVGKEPGQWSPGELLKLALLGCNAMSSDVRMSGVLGDDFSLSGKVEGVYNEAEDRYESFTVKLIPELGDLSEETVATMIRRALGAIERNCTIGRTIDHVVPHETIIAKED